MYLMLRWCVLRFEINRQNDYEVDRSVWLLSG